MAPVLAQGVDYVPLGILVLIAIVFAASNLLLTAIFGPGRRGSVKETPYESGMNPVGTARRRFNVRFYIVAMTFLIFDVEVVFFYPWATVFPNLGDNSPLAPLFLFRVLFFLATSVIAYLYAWRKGVFRFD